MKKVIVVGEMHQDLFYKTEIFSDLAKVLAIQLKKAQVEKKILDGSEITLEKEILEIIGNAQKKVPGDAYIKRGGNGNNSSNLLAKLKIPVQLMTTVGQGSGWMKKELESLGIDSTTVYEVAHATPVSTIIEDPKITKIIIAPNLKIKMNFEEVNIEGSAFQDASIVFLTPIADKYSKILDMTSEMDVITAMTVETQKISNESTLKSVCTQKVDILFANLNDAAMIIGLDTSETNEKLLETRLSKVVATYKAYSRCLVFTLGKYGSWIVVDEEDPFNIPIFPVEVKNRTGAGDTYAAGFIAHLFENIENKKAYESLTLLEKKDLLKNSAIYAAAASALKVSSGDAPDRLKIKDFIALQT